MVKAMNCILRIKPGDVIYLYGTYSGYKVTKPPIQCKYIISEDTYIIATNEGTLQISQHNVSYIKRISKAKR